MALPRLAASAPLTPAALWAVFVGVILVALPAGASAAKVEALPVSFKAVPIGDRVFFNAAAGEVNRVGVTVADVAESPGRKQMTIKDTGAALTAGTGCTQVDANTASCTLELSNQPWFALGDGDDELDADIPLEVVGQAGDDTIRLSDTTNSTRSLVEGGEGDDLVDASLARAIVLDGGPGGDLLIGSAYDDRIEGGKGNDELRGGDGKDEVTGGAGADKLTCGDGNADVASLDFSDRLLDPDTPTLSLGPLGASGVRAQAGADDAGRASVKSDCERLVLPAGSKDVVVDLGETGARLSGGALTLGRRLGPRRSAQVQLRSIAGKLLARGSLKSKTIRVRLTAAGAKTLRPGSRVTVRLVTRPAGDSGRAPKRKPGVQVDITVPKADEG